MYQVLTCQGVWDHFFGCASALNIRGKQEYCSTIVTSGNQIWGQSNKLNLGRNAAENLQFVGHVYTQEFIP